MYLLHYDAAPYHHDESDPIGLAGGNYSTYAYARGNPISASDPSGLLVEVIGHVAASPLGYLTTPTSYHSALYLKPDNPCQCKGDWPLTLGGQPFGGGLVSWPDNPGDSLANAQFSMVVPTPPGMTDCEFIQALIDAAVHYVDVPYSFPSDLEGTMAPGTYNSNSVTSGLIKSAGGTPPNIVIPGGQLPGYQNPVPISR